MPEAPAHSPTLSLWSIGAISVVAYGLTTVLHEALGHGCACLLVGGHPKTWQATFFACDMGSVSSFGRRIVNAAGSVINLITGGMALAILRYRKPQAHSLRYFLWLFSATGLLSAFGYLLFSGVAGVGDWVAVARDLIPDTLSRVLLALTGGALYFWLAPKLLMPEFRHFLDENSGLKPQIQRLLRYPYMLGGATVFLAGLQNPHAPNVVLVSAAAAAFGATSLLVWYPQAKIIAPAATTQQEPLTLRADTAWITAGVIALLFFIGILGQGIYFQS